MKNLKIQQKSDKTKEGTIMDKRKTGIFLLISCWTHSRFPALQRGERTCSRRYFRFPDIRQTGKHPLITTGEDSSTPGFPEQAAVSISAPQAILTSGPSYPEVGQNTTYTGGDQVACGGKIYSQVVDLRGASRAADVWEAAPQTPPPQIPRPLPKPAPHPSKGGGLLP